MVVWKRQWQKIHDSIWDAIKRKREIMDRVFEVRKMIKYMSYDDKVKLAHDVVYDVFDRCKNISVAFSGGKNSLIVLHIVKNVADELDKDFKVHFCNTTVEYKETVDYVHWLAKQWGLELYELRPKKGITFWKILEKWGLPNYQRALYGEPKCCYWLKVEPVVRYVKAKRIDCTITGITAEESLARLTRIAKSGLIFESEHISGAKLPFKIINAHPIGLWRDIDCEKYIKDNNLPVNPAYEKYGLKRCGCKPCVGFKNWTKELAERHPNLYKLVMKKVSEYDMSKLGHSQTTLDVFDYSEYLDEDEK